MKIERKPPWLKVKLPSGGGFQKLKGIINENRVHTICHEAMCPNVAECSGNGTASFLILGDKCSRRCLYCNVKSAAPDKVDSSEPGRVANAVKLLDLKYVVITSVTRDDLPDGGASMFAGTIRAINTALPGCKVEVLTPDFMGNVEALQLALEAKPFVFAHNVEAAMDLFDKVRPQGDFKRSLDILKEAKRINCRQKTKSGMMIGLGESKGQIIMTMEALRNCEVDIFTIGQYLQPSKSNCRVARYYSPDEFLELEEAGYKMGFSFVKAGPLVRSSYLADEVLG